MLIFNALHVYCIGPGPIARETMRTRRAMYMQQKSLKF